MSVPFGGSNERHEIESFDELVARARGRPLSELTLSGWVFQGVDFSALSREQWDALNVEGGRFWGCHLPAGVTANAARARGAEVYENPETLPFKPFRAFMYTPTELEQVDAAIFEHARTVSDLHTAALRAMHDYSMHDALYDYLEGKTVIGVMGGHGVRRSARDYARLTRLCRRLAREGFIICTGGGPGAMEAANLGAYLRDASEADVGIALDWLTRDADRFASDDENHAPVVAVRERFGPTAERPSLGIPTWHYGQEPSNGFVAFHAKFFSNATREDGLLQIANGGTLYNPGSAGTRQEVFQDACINHYGSPERARPMVFWGETYWRENGVFALVERTSRGEPYGALLQCTDDEAAIVDHFVEYRTARGLPVVRPGDLRGAFWQKSPSDPPNR